MKKKYADYSGWKYVDDKTFVSKYFDNVDYKGYVCLLSANKVNERFVTERDGKELVLLDDGYKWLEFYPEKNKNIAFRVLITDKNEIIDWFFDIAKNSFVTDAGVPYIEDLYLDLLLYPSGKMEKIDEDELKEALDNNDITKEDFDLAYKVLNNLIKEVDGKVNELTKFTKKYYDLIK